ncbi:MAG: choice-of-anchor J domain-containing protein [Candidatus Cloacimonetes bacterium]|nr:choice-of-anchor J domain-containing protein [Candidatus Cloacimonadota bacterium]
MKKITFYFSGHLKSAFFVILLIIGLFLNSFLSAFEIQQVYRGRKLVSQEPEASSRDSVVIFSEDFEDGLSGWTQEYKNGYVDWTLNDGGYNGHPSSAHSGSNNAFLFDGWGTGAGDQTRLISPEIDFGDNTSFPDLTLWLSQDSWQTYQDWIEVQYRNSEDDSWHTLNGYSFCYPDWHYIDDLPYLPDVGSTYQICILGDLEGGYGICIDDILITANNYYNKPGKPSDPTPDNGAVNIPLSTNLSWHNGGNTDSVEVFFGHDSLSQASIYLGPAIDTLSNSYIPDSLEYETVYYWNVVAMSEDFFVPSNTWHFQTAPEPFPGCQGFPVEENFDNGFENFNNNAYGNNIDWTLNNTLYTSSDSSAWNDYTANNNNLLTQTCYMDLTAKVNVYLQFNHIAKTQAEHDSCLVEISTDNGATWTKLPASTYMGLSNEYASDLCFWESSYDDWGTEDETPTNVWWKEEIFDLSSYNYSENALVRFRLVSDQVTEKYGWLIDDIEIKELLGYPDFSPDPTSFATTLDTNTTYDEILTISNNGNTDLLYTAVVNYPQSRADFFEDFESGIFPPAGWSEYFLGGSGQGWRYTTSSYHSPIHCTYHNDDDVSSPSEDWLVTTAISTTMDDTLYFWEKNKYMSGYYWYHGVWISTGSPNPDDGDFVELQEFSQSTSSWKKREIDLSAYNFQTIYIGFKYIGDYDTEWYIDDVGIDPGISDWLSLDGENYTEGTVSPLSSDEITVGYDTNGLDAGSYTGNIIFNHNAAGSPDTVTVNLNVIEGALLPPENVVITVADDSVHISWDAVDGANSYKIYLQDDPYATFPSGWTVEATGVTATSWCEDVSGSTKKFYRVTAVK